jgi:small subunit ribosomal protein S6
MFLLDSNRYARDPNGVSNEVNQIVKKCGGEILVSRLWSEQRLAYPIEGHRKGTYWLTYFKLDSLQQPALTRACQLSENILRNLILKVDHRLVDTLVKHAGSIPAPATARPASEAKSPVLGDVDVEVDEEFVED